MLGAHQRRLAPVPLTERTHMSFGFGSGMNLCFKLKSGKEDLKLKLGMFFSAFNNSFTEIDINKATC